MHPNTIAPLAISLAACLPASAVTVSVLLTDHQGEPIPDCGVGAAYEDWQGLDDPRWFGTTAADGSCVLDVTDRESPAVIEVRITIRPVGEDATMEDRITAVRYYYDLAADHRWPKVTRIPIAPGQSAIDVPIQCERAISADVRLLDESKAPIFNGTVRAVGGPIELGPSTDAAGRTRVVGILPERPITLFVSDGVSSVTHHMEFLAHADDCDLGDIVIPHILEDATVRIEVDTVGWQHEFGDLHTWNGVTCIRSDGSFYVSYLANREGRIVVHFLNDPSELLPIPSGTYFLLPGFFLDRPIDLRAFELVRTGQTELVPNWPTITVAPGKTATATVHAAGLDAAIQSTMSTR